MNRILMRRTALVERLMQDWLHWCGQSDVTCPTKSAFSRRSEEPRLNPSREGGGLEDCLRTTASLKAEVICPIPNPKPHPLCLFHTPEQAILAILVRKLVLQKQLPAGWPFYSYAPCLQQAVDET